MSSFNNTPSAVLVPIVEVGGELRFLYEVRSMALHWQPGDISFPGGKIEPSDSNAEAAAIRETMEELSVRREDIHILSPLDYVESVTGVDIYPFAAHLDAYENIRCTAEVDHLFTVPIRWFMNHQPEKADMDLATRPATALSRINAVAELSWCRLPNNEDPKKENSDNKDNKGE